MINKKANIQEYVLIRMIIFIVLLFVFIYISGRIKGNLEEGSIREIRRQSVKNNVHAHIAGIDASSELKFPIIRKTIKKDEEIKESSLALVHDWSDLLQGEEQLFPIKKEEIVYCIPGHYLKFKVKNKKIPVADYIEFQKTKTLDDINADVIGDGNEYILDYLKGYTTDESIFAEEMKELKEVLEKQGIVVTDDAKLLEKEKNIYAINTDYEYMTITVYMKKGYWVRWLSTVIGTPVGIVGGTVAGVLLAPVTGGSSLSVTIIALAGGTAGGIIGYNLGSDKSADWDTIILLMPNKGEVLKDLKCDILPAHGDYNEKNFQFF